MQIFYQAKEKKLVLNPIQSLQTRLAIKKHERTTLLKMILFKLFPMFHQNCSRVTDFGTNSLQRKVPAQQPLRTFGIWYGSRIAQSYSC